MSAATPSGQTTGFDVNTAPLTSGTHVLEASAGTGKTWSIVTLLVRLIAEADLRIDQILVVTFTRAATAELVQRTWRRLREARDALEHPSEPTDPALTALRERLTTNGTLDDGLRRLETALACFDDATITTIHSFCQQVLTEAALEAGAPYDVELLSDGKPLLAELATDWWVRRTSGLRQDELAVLETNNKVSLADLQDLANTMDQTPTAAILPDGDPAPAATIPPEWESTLADVRAQWDPDSMEAWFDANLPGLNKSTYGKGKPAGFITEVDEWLNAGAGLAQTPGNLAKLGAATIAAKTNKSWVGRIQAPPLSEALDDLVTLANTYAIAGTRWAESVKREFAGWLPEASAGRKARRGQWTFSDLLDQLAAALADPARRSAVQDAVRSRFSAALIDEFQDTDPVQWQIFRTLFAAVDPDAHLEANSEAISGPLYLVGDPKQSIFRFRGADIDAYRSATEAADQSFHMTTSYRSDARLVSALEGLYTGAELPFVAPGAEYVRVGANAGTRIHGAGDAIELHVVEDDLEAAAEDVASLLTRGVQIEVQGTRRPLCPRDIAVLAPTNALADSVHARLEALGVAAVRRGDADVLLTAEAEALRLLLTAVVEPTRRAAVHSALATELVGVRATELAALDADPAAWEQWSGRFRELLNLWEEQGFVRFFQRLLMVLELPVRLGRRPGGQRQLTNLLHLRDVLHAEVLKQRLAPDGLVAWLSDARAEADEAGTMAPDERQLRLETDADAVEVATVHAAKGLEWPVVVLVRLERNPRAWGTRNLRGNDPEPPYAPWIHIGLDDKKPLLDEVKKAQAAEQARLLYVALTRARHQVRIHQRPREHAHASAAFSRLFLGGAALSKDYDEVVATLRDHLTTAGVPSLAVRTRVPEAKPLVVAANTPTLAAARFPTRWLDTWWRKTSYSALTRGTRGSSIDDAELRDHDEAADDEVITENLTGLSAAAHDDLVPLAEQRGGAQLGTCLHAVLEVIPFDISEAALTTTLTETLPRHGLDATTAPIFADGLTRALETPMLPDGTRLRDIPSSDRLNELEFLLTVAQKDPAQTSSAGTDPTAGQPTRRLVTTAGLADCFEAHWATARGPFPEDYPAQLRQLAFAPTSGLLTGSIDLVFRRGGRYWLADYKSNHLGPHQSDYGPEGLTDAMVHHDYILQLHLYAVALHRYLTYRVRDYNYETHMGGALYLFLRGMTGGADRPGVLAHRPPAAFITALSDYLDTGTGFGASTEQPGGQAQ